MKPMSKSNRPNARKTWLPILAIVLIAAGGFGYFYWNKNTTVQAQSTESSLKTTQVRQGSITISASGSGTLVAGQESELAFSASGTVAKLNVQVGEQVKKGDTLAVLDDMDDLLASVNSAQQDLVAAQQELNNLKQNASANLANAEIKLVDARKAVDDAESSVVQKGWVRCDQKTLDAYYYQYTHAVDQLETLGDGGGSQDYYLSTIVPQKNIVAQAKAAYEYCAGYTDYEVSSTQANVSLAQAEYQQAQDTQDILTKNAGLDPIELATAENKVSNAEVALAQAQEKLDGATLKAPFDGTILSITGKAGDSVGTSTFITVADLAHPQVNFSIDETDMSKVAVGETANVTFDAVPNRTFSGKVVRVNPAIETVNNVQVVTGVIQLDMSKETDLVTLPKNLNASVELIQDTAENVLLVPLQAVHDLGDGTYSVFVVGANGQPTMKTVEVGLQDAASVQIKSGLKAGDVITTGVTQTK